jgi:hypothetical protein
MFCFVGDQVFDGSKKILTALLMAALFVPASLSIGSITHLLYVMVVSTATAGYYCCIIKLKIG